MKLKINRSALVQQAITATICQPASGENIVDKDGRLWHLASTGGITYNLRLGDSAYGWMGDHVEPEVSLENKNKQASEALNILACIGNEATVISGDAKGEKGYVIGRHSGVEHVMVHMKNPEALDRLMIGDAFRIRAHGAGMVIEGFEELCIDCIDPDLLEKFASINDEGKIEVPVAGKIPAVLMGSGIGMKSYRGDYDMITQDRALIEKLGLDHLRMGDIVLLEDCLNCFGRSIRRGAVSVGVVIHSDCFYPGHGPGIVNILSAPTQRIVGRLDDRCNIKDFME